VPLHGHADRPRLGFVVKDLTCSGCGKVVMKVRMVDFGFAIVFCVECGIRAVRSGLVAEFQKLGGKDFIVQPSREDG
jgi:hypothetical protein